MPDEAPSGREPSSRPSTSSAGVVAPNTVSGGVRDSADPGSQAPCATGFVVNKQFLFELGEVYTPLKWLGKGAYGVVCSATHGVTGARVAIKKIANCFDSATDARRTLREVRLLRHLAHDNVVALLDVLVPRHGDSGPRDIYLVYELMDTDLHQIVRSPQALTEEHCQYFVYQILRGLKYIHSANVLHRDLKPSNLLLNANCDLKICDFGLSRTGTAEKGFMTEYVVTRWYRAPELLLSCDEYGPSIDMWSVGCIFGEMLQRKPLFCGKDYIDQLKLIFALLGTPAAPAASRKTLLPGVVDVDDPLHFVSSPKAKQWIQSLAPQHAVPLADHFAACGPAATSPEGLDLLAKMLVFDPRKRISVAAALSHPYLAHLHDEALEPIAERVLVADPAEDSAGEAELRRMLLAECRAP